MPGFEPFTPIHRLFSTLDKYSSFALGKRSRVETFEAESLGVVDDRYSTTSPPGGLEQVQHTPAPRKACVALQNEDYAEDAIVITALDTIPFCCHEDLLTMPREKLNDVAQALNDKLPKILQVDTSSEQHQLRKSIEIIVGIRKQPPGAPKITRSLSALDIQGDYSPPTSPLAKRSQMYTLSSSRRTRLASLAEEEEEELTGPSERPIKRRRAPVGWEVDEKALDAIAGRMTSPTQINQTQNVNPGIVSSMNLKSRQHKMRSAHTSSRVSRQILAALPKSATTQSVPSSWYQSHRRTNAFDTAKRVGSLPRSVGSSWSTPVSIDIPSNLSFKKPACGDMASGGNNMFGRSKV